MASRGWRRPLASLPALALALLLLAVAAAAAGSPDRTAPSRPPLVLPLTLSYPNASRVASSRSRRGLAEGGHPSARMRLHDDLLTNGYYTTRLYIGTPPQEFALIVDSGSTVTYVPCASCEQCGNHQDPRFQPDLSSTYSPVKCNVDCNCNSDKSQCTYERQYAEMSSSSGVLGEDIVSFGTESELKPQRAVFGCENSETGDLFSQHADGIMGLGRGQLSIMDQLVDKGVIGDSFSMCYGGMDIGGGAMVLGAMPGPPDMVYTHSNAVRSPYYNIELKEIHVAGKPLRVDPRIFDGKHGTVLDSGTTYAYLPEQAFVAFKDAVTSKVHPLKKIRGPDPNYKDICFAGAGRNVSQLSEVFPKVDMVFGNGQKLSLSPENYLFRHSKVEGAYCLGVFQNGKDPTTLLGIVVRNTLVTYDRHNEKIGFWKTNCSELWERLQSGGAPSPASSSDPGSQADLSPAPAPSGLPEYDVGLIAVYMSINVTYPNLKPHLHELAELLAKELEIDSSQVRLMNVTGQGNSTLIRWDIFPAGSSNSMSNATAMGIIYRLTQHHVQLPEHLGSYQLLEWNVQQPVSRRSWLQEHVVSILVGVLLVVFLSLSAFLGLYLWRKKFRGQAAYRPVGSVGPEQELQPL
ncbi:hypothetical protein CFC21_022653 [Triticum aestivum]|uniref:Peptidase A1 domain-containing protein n=3 Tax=Triticum TaxID=4564 RepID=A0A9R1PIZ0_TRITD|nr:hypothetical protein CFC21_022653 [Triticum aestivum]VAH44232.1 unnamed protein product [Triticum turgidum subsp. durum]